jgi:hypothetical protein
MTYDLGVFKRQRYVYPTFNAVGGTISYYTLNGVAYTVHTFLSTGTNNFTIFSTATVDMLLVGGGAGGGGLGNYGGGYGGIGGDAGQFVTATNVTLNIGQYNVTVGNGGASSSTGGTSSIVGSVNVTHATTATGGAGQTGAGAGGPGSISNDGGAGGPGLYNNYNGTNTAYAGGGGNGGAGFPGNSGAGGVGGGGVGANGSGNQVGAGTPNTGGGGGGNAAGEVAGIGGSGIVIIRYPTPINSVIPISDIYFNYVSLLLSNQTTNVTTPTFLSTVPAITFDYLIVAGGGGGNGSPTVYSSGGGGGGGGLIYGTSNSVLLPGGLLTITVGSGGVVDGNGNSSSINSYTGLGFQAGSTSTIIAIGGGKGGYGGTSPYGTGAPGNSGGSGGGGGGANSSGSGAGSGGTSTKITYSLGINVSATSLGNSGGNAIIDSFAAGGGGGGAGSVGSVGATGATVSGGSGYTWLNSNTYAAGGRSHNYNYGAPVSVAGASFTGNGGDGNGGSSLAAAGGSGIVIIRYSGTNVLATGGTISTVSNYVYHTFTTTGGLSFTATIPSSTSTNYTSPIIRYLLVGGGGGAGNVAFSNGPGGGGAGGLFTGTFTITNIATLLSITVGASGASGYNGATGGNSSITSNYVNITAYGGGGGAGGGDGGAGGSGGGAGSSNSGSGSAAAGGTNLNGPGTVAGGYGNVGGGGSSSQLGGGGGAGGPGQSSGPAGGPGLYITTPYSEYSRTYASGGNANGSTSPPGTGNGGGGAGSAGGSGISILWEPFSNPMPTVIGAPTIVTTSGYRVYVFTSTGALVYGNSLSNTKFTDNSTNSYPILYNGNPSQGSFNPYAKNWSVYFDGSSYLLIPNSASYGTTRLNLSANSNFTIEGWAYFNSVAGGMLIAHENTIWRIGVSSGTLQYSLSSNGSNYAGIASSVSMGTVVVGRWYHFALVRNGSTFTPYLNGIAGTPTISSAGLYVATSEGLTIGMGDTSNYFSGYLSNIRILKGTAAYTGPFTPAISPLPLVENTLLLTCSNSIWDDVSNYNWLVIPKGRPAVKKFSPFSNFGLYDTTLVGGSAYFNGSTDYLTVSSTSTTNVPNWTYLHNGTTDYTIEGWIYPLSTATQQGLIGTSDISNTAVSGMALYLTSGGVLSWAIMNGSASFPSGTVSNSVKPNAWSHIACTFASSNKTTNLYVNGVRVATSATTTATFTATSASYPLTIGRSAVSTLNTYSGYISNLRILKGVISDGVVTSNISSGTTVEYLVVAGGGGAPSTGNGRGGGGAGGFRTGTFITTQSGAIYTITVGSGGNGGNVTPTNGGESSIVGSGVSLVSAGGGCASPSVNAVPGNGGSGGGGGSNLSARAGGTGNTPPTVPAQGYNGGDVTAGTGGGGGGGAGGAGANTNDAAGVGGPGALSDIDGLGYYYSGGGGGYSNPGAGGGTGGGAGTNYASNTSGRNIPSSNGNGGLNTGGGGYGGFSTGGAGGGGGSGCVIIRYFGPQRATGGNIVTTNISGYTVHTFLSSGVFTDSVPSYRLPVAPVVASSTATNLLLNFTDSVIVDASSNTDIYTDGDAGLASSVKKYNNMSMYFDGTTGTGLIVSTSSAVALGYANFTVEMWMYPLTSYNSGNAPALLDARTTGNGAGLIRFGFNGTTIYGGPQIAWIENVTTLLTATVILNVWQHIAVVNNSGVLTMYNNGTVISTASNSTNLIVPFKYIGKSYNNLPFNGYIDDLRITNGIARYTSAFTPPIQKLQLK